MANEWLVTHQVRLINGSLKYDPGEVSFRADQTTKKGPSPGFLLISTAGEDITFTDLTTPGIVVIKNLDAANFVEYGIWDGSTFHELGEVLAGEEFVFRMSRNMTGFRMKADTAEVAVQVLAFDK